jgi:predicted amidohydrolase
MCEQNELWHRKAEGFSMGKLRIAVVQSTSAVGTETFDPRDDNLARALAAIDTVARQGAELIIFGEMYLSGYRTDEWLYKWATVLEPPDTHVQALMETAKRKNVHILMGVGTFGNFIPGDVYNSTLFIGPDGLIGVYRKTHVAGFAYSEGIATERCFYSPGKELPVFDTPRGRIGVHICYDITFPEVSRVQALKGAELLVNTSASAAGFEEFWEHALFMRAAENKTWYIVCSVVGTQRGTVLFGGSRVVDPNSKVVAAAKFHEEDTLLVDIDLDLARHSRVQSHAFSIRQPELYAPIAQSTSYP